MSFSFKKFVELVDQEEVTEDQINELFGIFGNKEKPEDVAKKRSDEFKARREALRQKAAGVKPKDDEKVDPNKKVAIKPGQPRTAAAAGRAAERDWLNNME
jgi:hypothetical protein